MTVTPEDVYATARQMLRRGSSAAAIGNYLDTMHWLGVIS